MCDHCLRGWSAPQCQAQEVIEREAQGKQFLGQVGEGWRDGQGAFGVGHKVVVSDWRLAVGRDADSCRWTRNHFNEGWCSESLHPRECLIVYDPSGQ